MTKKGISLNNFSSPYELDIHIYYLLILNIVPVLCNLKLRDTLLCFNWDIKKMFMLLFINIYTKNYKLYLLKELFKKHQKFLNNNQIKVTIFSYIQTVNKKRHILNWVFQLHPTIFNCFSCQKLIIIWFGRLQNQYVHVFRCHTLCGQLQKKKNR